jgi:F-type H+-transporting ATPase subunit alpha
LPAVDVGRSVSRVGGKAQLPAFRALGGPLKLAYAQFEELEAFARFGAKLDPDTRAQLERGRLVRDALKQDEGAPIPVMRQIMQLLAVTEGLFDDISPDQLDAARAAVVAAVDDLPAAQEIVAGAKLDDDRRAALLSVARAVLRDLGDVDA